MHNYNIILVGILAGAWPCGTIALVAELFGSESKSQVYGSLHTFVQENHAATFFFSRGPHTKQKKKKNCPKPP